MKTSNLQFTDPHIKKIDFRIGEEVVNSSIPISIGIEDNINPRSKEASIDLNLVIGEISADNEITTSFYFNGTISANFRWKEDIEDLDGTLKVSGGTVLLSYMRPILANLTMQAGIKPLNLPFVNFTE